MNTLLLNHSDVGKLVDLDQVYKAVADGYRAYNRGKVKQPGFLDLNNPKGEGSLDIKAGTDEDSMYMSVKISSGNYINNPEHGLPIAFNEVILLEADTSRPLCIMDGAYITGCRTAAAGAISVNELARQNASVLCMIGAGDIAKRMLRAIIRVRPIRTVYVWNRTKAHAKQYANEMTKELGITILPVDTIEEGCRNADIIVCSSRVKTGPILKKEWIRPGTHIVEAGTDSKLKQVLEPDVLKGVKLVCDSIRYCCERGETCHALEAGSITTEDIYAEIGEILLGEKPGRVNDEEITVFDTVGMAIQDISMARAIYEAAVHQKMGSEFDFLL